jgi:hypothetical protein
LDGLSGLWIPPLACRSRRELVDEIPQELSRACVADVAIAAEQDHERDTRHPMNAYKPWHHRP